MELILQAIAVVLVITVIAMKVFLELMKINGFKGAFGEYKTRAALVKLSEYPLIKNPIYKNSKGESCEVDIILLHPTGIYVIENKCYSGWIFGKEDQYQWTQSLSKKNKFRFYNPIMQNRKHMETLKEILGVYNNIFYSVVIFNNGCTLKNVEFHSDMIVNTRTEAVSQIKDRMQNANKFLSKVDLDIFYKKLMEKGCFDKESRKKHIQSIKQKQGKAKM